MNNKKIQSQVLKDLDLKLKDGERYHGDDYIKKEVEKAISRTIELMEEELEGWKKHSSLWLRQGRNEAKAEFRRMLEDYRIENHAYRKRNCSPPNQTNCTSCNILFQIFAKLGEDNSPPSLNAQKNVPGEISSAKGVVSSGTCICGHINKLHFTKNVGASCRVIKCKCKKFQEVGK